MTQLAPVAARERIATLDVLRGFALLGVMIGNMTMFSGAWADRGAPKASSLDSAASWIIEIFVESKAQTLLTLLFGFGFAVQLLRADARGEPVMALYVRRLVALFVIGALHVVLLWWGDVTWTYAVTGFGLLLFHRASNRARLIAAVALTLVPYLVTGLPGVAEWSLGVFMTSSDFEYHTLQMAAAVHRSTHAGLSWEHLRYALVWATLLWTWYFWWVLGRFLFGYVVGKARWFDRDGADHLPAFHRMLRWGLLGAAIGVALHVVGRTHLLEGYEIPLPIRLVFGAGYQIGLLGTVATYVALVVLLMQRPRWQRVLRAIAPVGRMPLTTYIMQSAICTFVFYGWGLGWAGSTGPAAWLAIAAVIFAAQIAIAHLWLRWFRFGPLEWLWRWAVYLRRPAMLIAVE